MKQEQTLAQCYDSLERDRSEWLESGHRSAVLTIPSVQPREGQNNNQLPRQMQSVGARGVANLSSKLGMTLFPTSIPFMRLKIAPADMAELMEKDAQMGDKADVVSEVEASLQMIETQAQDKFQTSGWRPVISAALRQLVVTGNCLIWDRPGGSGPVMVDLRRYVVERDPEGQLTKCVLKQTISKTDAEAVLGIEISEEMMRSHGSQTNSQTTGQDEKTMDLFTGVYRLENGKMGFHQEIAGMEIPETYRTYAEVECPLMPLRFTPVYGESYGRGFVEDLWGDLTVLTKISQALAEASMIMSKVIFLARPGSMTKPNVINTAPNGAIVVGDGEDISAVQADKSHDLSVSYNVRNDLVASLSKAFLLNSSVQRQAERVTAEEISVVARELEDALGSVYASLADTVQRPVVEYVFAQMKRLGEIVGIPDSVKPVVATGLEAISRNHKAARISQLLAAIQQVVPPQDLPTFLKVDNIVADLATSLNLPDELYVRSPEEIAQIREQQQQQAAVETLGPEAMRQMGNQQQQS